VQFIGIRKAVLALLLCMSMIPVSNARECNDSAARAKVVMAAISDLMAVGSRNALLDNYIIQRLNITGVKSADDIRKILDSDRRFELFIDCLLTLTDADIPPVFQYIAEQERTVDVIRREVGRFVKFAKFKQAWIGPPVQPVYPLVLGSAAEDLSHLIEGALRAGILTWSEQSVASGNYGINAEITFKYGIPVGLPGAFPKITIPDTVRIHRQGEVVHFKPNAHERYPTTQSLNVYIRDTTREIQSRNAKKQNKVTDWLHYTP